MQPGEVVAWLDAGTSAADLAVEGFDLVRSGGPIAVFRAHAAAGKTSLLAGTNVADSVEKATVDAAAVMESRAGVRCATANYMLKATVEPNDTFYTNQWHYPQINLPQAWSITQGSANVIVAVLDTGIASAHPDFDPARFVSGFDMISNPTVAGDGDGRDSNPEDNGDFETPQGSSFHGTHVAGTIGARTNNSVGVAGVDWNCKLMIVRCLGRGGGSVDDIAQAILYAAGVSNASGQVPAQRADVINMSLGGPGLSSVLEAACDAAAAAGSLLVAAAGNDNTSDPGSPAAFNSVLSVGAVDLVRARAPYSNFSTTVDVWAPGGDMSADRNGDTFPDGVLSCSANDAGQFFYQFENGTSMASPHVAGLAALVKAANPALTAAQIRAILIGSTTTQAGVGLPNGGRIVDALLAVQAAGGSAVAPLLVATPNVVDFGATSTTSTVTLENRGTGNLAFSSSVANPAAPWLSGLISDATPGNGIDDDSIVFTADRTGLANDVYQTIVTLTYLDGATPVTVDLEVRLQVGASTSTSDEIFVLLVDPTTLETRYQTSTRNTASFAFSFAGVTSGQYLLVAGTDRDNDQFLGDQGELFGAWPDLDDPQPITIVGGVNNTNLSFGMQDLVTVQSAGGVAGRSFARLE
jgi:serine protease